MTRFRKLHIMWRLVTVPILAFVLVAAGGVSSATVRATDLTRYIVVFAGTQAPGGQFELGGNYNLYHQTALNLVSSAGGTVTLDLSRQIGVMMVESANSLFANALRASQLVQDVGENFSIKTIPSYQEAVQSGMLTVVREEDGGGPEPGEDPLEPLQWSMELIHAPQAHATQAGWRAVDVGVLDTGIDGAHLDFVLDTNLTNVDCLRGRDFVGILNPGVGTPAPCVDNNFHGTHVAGIIAAQANGHGVVGVAPNVTLVPVKVCDAVGYCYANSAVAAITYAGDIKLDVINMSFFVDDDQFLASTEFKCNSDPDQRAFRRAVERAIQYARSQGVTPVAALGNSDSNLADPPPPYDNDCDVVPAETQGVIGTMALGPGSEKAYYSSYGVGAADVAAPGGNSRSSHGEIPGPCGTQVLSTIPGNVWGCFQGTSMASPHAAGVAALIVSQFGTLGEDGDVEMRPTQVEAYLQDTTIDIGERGYDQCFGNGRIDAERAVQHETSGSYQAVEPCAEE